MTDPLESFKEAMLTAGLTPPDHIEPGRFHRFPGAGKKNGNKAGWCKLFPDGEGGTFGDYSTDLSESWQTKRDKPINADEWKEFQRQIAEARKQAERERQAAQAVTAEKSAVLWKKAKPAKEDHPYLMRKSVKAHGIKQTDDGRLLVPLFDASGKLWSVQAIDGGGDKRFFPDGRTKGCYFPLGGKPTTALCICEGYATGASIHQATDYPVAVAFNAGNLKAVAEAIRAKLPEARLILCADDDHGTEGNPGLTKAREAAQAVGGLVAVPDFGPERPEKATDFNDLATLRGPETVKECIEQARAVDSELLKNVNVLAGKESEPSDDEATLQHLAALSPLEYDRARKNAAKALSVRDSTLDKLVAALRKDAESEDGLTFDEVEPWPDPVDGAQLLTDLSAMVRRFIICAQETADAVALWAAMTWLIDVVQVAPLAIITAPEKRCGKSQLLFLLGRLVARPLAASNISTAALFRTIDAWRPTLLVDEADAFMRDNEELRGLLNSGHTRDGAYIVRVVGDDHEPKRFNTWGAKALAGISAKTIAATLTDRALLLELRRKLPHEKVDRLRYAETDLFETLAAKLCRFAEDNREAVRLARPILPPQLNDRAQDNWEPLLAIADAAGGAWPSLANKAALALSSEVGAQQSIGVELLSDIREVFEAKKVDRISTADLIAALCGDDEKLWATYNRGFPIKPRQVAARLNEYGIRGNTIRVNLTTAKGYMLAQFPEAFSRYLASPPSPSVTPSQAARDKGFPVTDSKPVTVTGFQKVTRNPAPDQGCDVVTDKKGGSGENITTLFTTVADEPEIREVV